MSEARKGAAVVTGASTGIGRATALRLAANGFRVFAGIRKPEDGEQLERDATGELQALRIDVTAAEEIDAAAEVVSEAVGDAGLAGLVNNAGMAVGGPMEFIPLDDLRRQLEVNLVGQVAVTQALLAELRRGRGRIVFVTSVGGRVASPFFGPYNASKFGLEAIADSLRGELRPWGIEVSTIEPGSVATKIWERGVATAEVVRGRMDPEVEPLYGEALDAVTTVAGQMEARGIPPERVAEKIEHALTARRPRRRYLIGRDARVMVGLSSVLPRRTYDALLARMTSRGD